MSLLDMMLSCFVVWLGKGQRQPENAFFLWITWFVEWVLTWFQAA
ncbi:hypothetical protein [Kingella oralis]